MEDISTKVRSNGRSYSIRSNRDRFFFPGEWGKFTEQLKCKQKHTFKCYINTGARHNELAHTKFSDIDFVRKRIILRVTKVKAAKKEKRPRPRIIPISSQFARYLKKYKKDNKLSDDDYIGMLSNPAANIGMKKALVAARINDYYMFSVHNVRKTLECWLMALGIDGLKLTAHFGHSMGVAAQSYLSADVLTFQEKKQIRMIIGDLYER